MFSIRCRIIERCVEVARLYFALLINLICLVGCDSDQGRLSDVEPLLADLRSISPELVSAALYSWPDYLELGGRNQQKVKAEVLRLLESEREEILRASIVAAINCPFIYEDGEDVLRNSIERFNKSTSGNARFEVLADVDGVISYAITQGLPSQSAPDPHAQSPHPPEAPPDPW